MRNPPGRVTVDEITRHIEEMLASNQHDVLALRDWITSENERRATAHANAMNEPIQTNVGPLIPGRYYDVTVLGNKKQRTLRSVTPHHGRWGDALVYASGKTAVHLYGYIEIVRATEVT